MITQYRKHKELYLYVVCMTLFVVLATSGYFFVNGLWVSEKEPDRLAPAFMTDMAYVDLPRITVSMGDSSSYMLVDLSIEVARKDAAAVERFEPQITDRLNLYFANMPPDRLGTSGPQSMLRKDLIIQINKAKAPVVVYDLLFRQMLVR